MKAIRTRLFGRILLLGMAALNLLCALPSIARGCDCILQGYPVCSGDCCNATATSCACFDKGTSVCS